MKRNLLVSASGVSLLCLLAGLSPVKALAAEIGSSEKLSEKEISSQEIASANTIISEKVNNHTSV